MDSQPLSKSEKNLVGYYQSFNNWSVKRRASKLKRSSGFATPGSRQTNDTTPASSIGSFRSFQFEGSTSSTGKTPNEIHMILNFNLNIFSFFCSRLNNSK